MWVVYILFGLLVCLNLLDYFLTEWVLKNGGVEKNPAAKYIIDRWGMKGFGVSKVILVIAFGALLQTIPVWLSVCLLTVLNAFYGYIVYNNKEVIGEIL